MELILVRHGETQLNCEKKFCGWSNPGLTAEGLLQAKAAGDKLKHQPIHQIFCSDLSRTMQTAEQINRHHQLEIKPTKNLREMNFGLWEGLTYTEIQKQYPKEAATWGKDWLEYAVPEGESLQFMYDRIIQYTEEIVNHHEGKRVLIVSHAGCIRAILTHYIGRGIQDYWRYKVNHCGIAKIEILDDYAVLAALNQ